MVMDGKCFRSRLDKGVHYSYTFDREGYMGYCGSRKIGMFHAVVEGTILLYWENPGAMMSAMEMPQMLIDTLHRNRCISMWC